MRSTTVLLNTALVAVLGLLLLAAAGEDDATAGAPAGIDAAMLPPLARQLLPLITQLTAQQCPELPPVWVLAQVQAESGWDPAATSSDSNGGAAGLYQLDQQNWTAAGGAGWPSNPPRAGADILDPATHLRVAIPWVCAQLRAVSGPLAATGKPTDPLDAMLVCHIAGCSRVSGSATGVPRAGEAGCGQLCADLVRRYLDAVHRNLARYGMPVDPPRAAPTHAEPSSPEPAAPAPYPGGVTGCSRPDRPGPTAA